MTDRVKHDRVSDDYLNLGRASDAERTMGNQPRGRREASLQDADCEAVDGLDGGSAHNHVETADRASPQRVGGDRATGLEASMTVV